MFNETWVKKLACIIDKPERYFYVSDKHRDLITGFEYTSNGDLIVNSKLGNLFKVSKTTIEWLLPNTIKLPFGLLYLIFKECFNLRINVVGDFLFIFREVVYSDYFSPTLPKDVPKIILCNSLEFWIDERNLLAYKVDSGISKETLSEIYFKACVPLFKHNNSNKYISLLMSPQGNFKLVGLRIYLHNINEFVKSEKQTNTIYPQIFLSKVDLVSTTNNPSVGLVTQMLTKLLADVQLEHPILDNRIFTLHYEQTDDVMLRLKHEYYVGQLDD